MNKDRILALADLIETLPHTDMDAPKGFNMTNWTHDCGTPSCIAGWAIAMNRGDMNVVLPKANENGFFPESEAGNYLGLGVDQSDELFQPSHHNWSTITPEHAANTLRHLVETGDVDWDDDA